MLVYYRNKLRVGFFFRAGKLLLFIILPFSLAAQENSDMETKKVVAVSLKDSISIDSIKIIEDAPLDISQNRGLFIVTPDGNMQLRILGSVRYLVVFDNNVLNSKNGFNTIEIPTPGINQNLPNFYNGLDQTRLGFEVTRKTDHGNVFIRLETDFAGSNGFRIRHAYGQIRGFLLGQTWSLFSHINALPSIVDSNGPTGAVVARTPQIRYAVPELVEQINFAFGLEYFPPDLDIPDSIGLETFQLLPDFTVRLDRSFDWGNAQLSGILPVLSGSYNNNLELVTGWGISASCIVNSWQKGKWYFQGVGGKAISRYFDDLQGNGFDIVLPPEGSYLLPFTYGYYATYEHNWTQKVYSNITYGSVVIDKKNFEPNDVFHKGHTFRINTFWDITDGAKAGGEVIWGRRFNMDNAKGNATRINFLFYYDF